MLLCSSTKFTKKKTSSVFPAFCQATFHHALIMCCSVFQAGYKCLMYHDRDTFDFSAGHLTKTKPMVVPV